MEAAARRVLAWLLLDRRTAGRAFCLSAAFVALKAVALAAAAGYDDVLWLPGKDLGLVEHPGIPTILVPDFAVLTLLGFAARRFLRIPSRVPVSEAASSRRLLRRSVRSGRETLLLRGRAAGVLYGGNGRYQNLSAEEASPIARQL